MRRMVKKQKVDLLFLKETEVSRILSFSFNIRGLCRCGWEWVPSDKATGSLVVICNYSHKSSVFHH